MSKVVIPSSTLIIKSSLDCWKSWSRVEFYWKVAFCFTSSRNDSIIGKVEYVHVIWFTSPNHDLAFVRSVSFGKFLIADNIWLDGAIPARVNFSPTNSTLSLQNLNFLPLITIQAMAQRYSYSQIWKNKSSMLLSCNKVSSTILSFLGTSLIISSYLWVYASLDAR